MGKNLSRIERRGVVEFKPQEALRNDAKADAAIRYARQVKDWPTLQAAIDAKIEDQTKLVQWWKETVSPRQHNKVSAERGTLSMRDAETLTGLTNQQVSKWGRRLNDPDKYRAMLFGTTYQTAMAEKTDIAACQWTGDPEWYTPPKYIEAARAVMGSIDLDPASNEYAQKTVRADEWFGKRDDGLAQQWNGRVFLNPPYGQPDCSNFVEKLCADYAAGNVPSAVLLTDNRTDTRWWHLAATTSAAICFTLGRINFQKEGGSGGGYTNGQTFFYLGSDVDAFITEFSPFGLIWNRIVSISKPSPGL